MSTDATEWAAITEALKPITEPRELTLDELLAQIRASTMSINEVRALRGLDPLPHCDLADFKPKDPL